MTWLASIIVALLTAAVGLMLGGWVASLAVSWYRVSSFEGASGYFVVALALLGFVTGLIIGLVMSRAVADSYGLGFWRTMLASQLTVAVIAGIIAGAARLAADVPPTLGGERLMLAVEIGWFVSTAAATAKVYTLSLLDVFPV